MNRKEHATRVETGGVVDSTGAYGRCVGQEWRCVAARLGSTLLAFVLLIGPVATAGGEDGIPSPLARRATLIEAFETLEPAGAAPLLTAGLDDEAAFVRRTAAHLLARTGRPAGRGLGQALGNEDPEVRRIALQGLADAGLLPMFLDRVLQDGHRTVRDTLHRILRERMAANDGAAEALLARLKESFPQAPSSIRQIIVQILSETDPLSREAEAVLVAAARDADPGVREEAFQTLLARADPEDARSEAIFAAAAADVSERVREEGFRRRWEREPGEPMDLQGFRAVHESELPESGWRFRRDPDRVGHREGWYEAGHDDGDWKEIGIGSAWHTFIDESYIGVAWYRRMVDVPPAPAGGRIWLRFLGVDEMTWVWVNGRPAGQHNIGSAGWDVPFHLDITDAVEPGRTAKVTVRVMNTAGAGGIWRPVLFQVFEPAP